MSKTILILIVSTIYFFSVSNAFSQEMGSLKGTVIDKDNGDPLISATVFIKGTKKGANTKFDGTFLIKDIPAGTYDIEISYIGFKKYEITGLEIKPGKLQSIEVLMLSDVSTTEEVVVTAKAVKETGAALLKERQKAAAFSDAIGAQEIARSGGNDAGDALKKVTGATVVGGKQVLIRGLGNRYALTQLNGASLASADPDQKTVDMDMFQAGMIENITTIKTATPDKPGDFTGGAVDIKTKSFPEKFYFNMSTSGGYNPQFTGNPALLGSRGNTDWLGFDDGSRAVPQNVRNVINETGTLPNPRLLGLFRINDANRPTADSVQYIIRSFNNSDYVPRKSFNVPVNSNVSLSTGNQFKIFNNPFGYVASLNHSRNYLAYENAEFGRYVQQSASATSLFPLYQVEDTRGQEDVRLNGMVNLNYNFLKHHEIGFNYIVSQNATHTGRYHYGFYNSSALRDKGFASWSTRYIERQMRATQVSGKHFFPFLMNAKLDWQYSISSNKQYEPDARFFAYDFEIDQSDTTGITPHPEQPDYGVMIAAYNAPTRIFRDLTENANNLNINLEIPLDKIVGGQFKFKTGYYLFDNNRRFFEERFEYASTRQHIGRVDINGDPYDFNIYDVFERMAGWRDNNGFYEFPMYINYLDPNQFSYNGESKVDAIYGMFDFTVFKKLRIITGIRYETSFMRSIPFDTSLVANYENYYRDINNIDDGEEIEFGLDKFGINEKDFLPSLNMVYQVSSKTNLRFAYYRTLARPNLREIAPYPSFDFIGDFLYYGNPFLKRTIIDNYDLRFEWFPNPGETFTVSFFGKDFDRPLERIITSVNDQITFTNARRGKLLGAEFEFRKNIGKLLNEVLSINSDLAEQFSFAFNYTLTRSEVDIASKREIAAIRAYDSTASLKRDFLNQSPYVVNFDIAYSNQKYGTDISTNFNVFGSRLSFISYGGSPDVYERPRPDLNFIFNQRILKNLSARFSVSNILNSYVNFSQIMGRQEAFNERYLLGRNYSLRLSFNL